MSAALTPKRRGLIRKISVVILVAVILQSVTLLFWAFEAVNTLRAELGASYLRALEDAGALKACDANPTAWRSPGAWTMYPVAPDGQLYLKGGPEITPLALPPNPPPGLVMARVPEIPRAIVLAADRPGPCRIFVLGPWFERGQLPALGWRILTRLVVDAVLIVALSLAIGLPLVRRIRRMVRAAQATVEADFDGRLPEPPDELGDLGAAFNQATAAARSRLSVLQRRDAVLRETLADLAHDVRTPLATLKLGLSGHGLADDTQGALRAEVEHLDALFQNLASLLQFEASGLDIQTTALDAGAVLESVALRFGVLARDKGVSLEVALPDDPLPVEADPVALAQALGNLVHNAIKFGRSSVTLAGLRRDQEIRLQVFDDGPGVDLAELPRLAERRYRGQQGAALTDDRGRRGQGLGLAIAREVAERHHGSLTLSPLDDEGGGTVATLTLPAADP